jgi:outer membrane immunogenic protein
MEGTRYTPVIGVVLSNTLSNTFGGEKMKRLLLASAAAIALSAPALAADLSARMPVKAPAYVAAYSWTGFYLGVNIGGAFGNRDLTETVTPLVGAPGSTSVGGNLSGVIGGGQIGYNWQTGNLLFGVEADIQGSGERGDSNTNCGFAGCTFTDTERVRWFGTARGRVGYAADRWLFYVTGGGAWQNYSRDLTVVASAPFAPATFGLLSESTTRFGWTLGGGVETALWGNWTGGVEYLYIDTGNFTNTTTVAAGTAGAAVFGAGSTVSDTVRLKNNIVRAKLNYRF